MDHLVLSIFALLIAYAHVGTVAEYMYNNVASRLHYDRKAFNSLKESDCSDNSSITLATMINAQLPFIYDAVSDSNTTEGMRVTIHWDGFIHSTTVDGDDDDGDYNDNEIVMIKSNEFELLAVGAAIATVTVVLLLATCIILVLYMNRFIGVTFAYEIEQLKCGPPAIETVRRTGVEDVSCCQPSCKSFVSPRQVSKKGSSKSYFKILLKLSATVQINRRLMKQLLNIINSVLQSKASTGLLENKLIELQRSMDTIKKNNVQTLSKWKNRAQKLRMKSDHHKRQESYLEDRCEELRKHNEHLMNFFKNIHEQLRIQKTHHNVKEVVTDDNEISYPVQEENPSPEIKQN